MKTIEIFKKKYRELIGSHQNQAINKIHELFEGVSRKAIEDAIWDVNPFVWYSYDCRFIKFEPKTFGGLCALLNEHDLSYKASQ